MAAAEGPPSAGERAFLRPEPREIVVRRQIARADIAALCDRVRRLLAIGGDVVVCDVRALVRADAGTVDALARLQLTARRSGGTMVIRGACGELRDLLGFFGLEDVLPCGDDSGIEPRRQAEEWEQPVRVQEEADPGDPTA